MGTLRRFRDLARRWWAKRAVRWSLDALLVVVVVNAVGAWQTAHADGGVGLERAVIEAKISELVGRYLASRDQAGA